MHTHIHTQDRIWGRNMKWSCSFLSRLYKKSTNGLEHGESHNVTHFLHPEPHPHVHHGMTLNAVWKSLHNLTPPKYNEKQDRALMKGKKSKSKKSSCPDPRELIMIAFPAGSSSRKFKKKKKKPDNLFGIYIPLRMRNSFCMKTQQVAPH